MGESDMIYSNSNAMQEQREHQLHKQGPIRVALLGTGIFAANCTFPTIRKLPDKFKLVAVWSRRKESVDNFLEKHVYKETVGCSPKTQNDNVNIGGDDQISGFSGDEGLDQILHNSTLAVDAIVMALPIDAQPAFIELALNAGKHVLSEKPIAATLEEAKRLIRVYKGVQQEQSSLQWSVAENFRYEPAIERVAMAVAGGEIGKPTLFSLLIRLPFKPGNKYLGTEWRSKPKWYGGLMPDVFVHSTALLRKVFAKSHYEPEQVSAITTNTANHIPSIDTMSATLTFANTNNIIDARGDGSDGGNGGDANSHVHGTVSLSFACTYVKYEFEVNGDKGAVLLQRKTKVGDSGYIVTVLDENGQERSKEEFGYGGIEKEFVAFADACCARHDIVDDGNDDFGDCNTPLEAMRDIELVEACLKSGIENGKPIGLPLS